MDRYFTWWQVSIDWLEHLQLMNQKCSHLRKSLSLYDRETSATSSILILQNSKVTVPASLLCYVSRLNRCTDLKDRQRDILILEQGHRLLFTAINRHTRHRRRRQKLVFHKNNKSYNNLFLSFTPCTVKIFLSINILYSYLN